MSINDESTPRLVNYLSSNPSFFGGNPRQPGFINPELTFLNTIIVFIQQL